MMITTDRHRNNTERFAFRYVVLLALAILGFVLIRSYGERLSAFGSAASEAASAVAASKPVSLGHVLLAMIAVITTGLLLGRICRLVGQPPVIGEVIAGIVLGPSLLGYVWPQAMTTLLPSEVAPYLGVIAQLGVILYMFLVGLELNADILRQRASAVVLISHASIVAPFLLGAALALWLYPRLAHDHVSFTSFSLFIGVAMAITAFPVLARILTDRGLDKTELGVMALSCAAADDVTAWCLLAFVVGVAQMNLDGAIETVALAAGYLVFMFVVVRPLALRLLTRTAGEELSRAGVAVVLVALLASALATESIGIHALFGAFLLGAVLPHDSVVARTLTHKLEDIVAVLFLPAFFAYTGMRTQIGLLVTAEDWWICIAITLVATIGKFGGTYAAARVTGLGRNDSAALGILMNTRGLMELIVLNIGFDLGVISPRLFAMMVIMALVTTVATTPVLHRLRPATR